MSPALWAAVCGMVLGLGLWSIASGALTRPTLRLSDAIELLDGTLAAPDPATGTDRLGSWVRFKLRRPVGDDTMRRLRMAGRSIDRHFTLKALAGLSAGVATLLLAALGSWIVGAGFAAVGVAAAPAAAAAFFVPDVLLAAGDRRASDDATEALLSYFDLVTLERLANLSGSQALRSAAGVSDVTVFVLIAEALERSRLEQRAPYGDLKRLAAELQLPALADIADVMSLDESGASLATALQARVKELRDAHLTEAKVGAAAVSERMTFFMVVPALVFAGFFLAPPLLRLIAG